MSVLSVNALVKMTEAEAHALLCALRWGFDPACPRCGCVAAYEMKTRPLFKCKACNHQFSVTSGTILASSKISAKEIILFACLFSGAVKGVSSVQLSTYMGYQQKTAWVFAHKFREAVQRPDLRLSGVVQIDGCTIGGYRSCFNMVSQGYEKRHYRRHFDNRRIVVVAREISFPETLGRTKCFVGKKESDCLDEIRSSIEIGSTIHADGARAWDGLNKLFEMMRINHDFAYSANGACTNYAESFFSQLRKMAYGTHHKIGAANLSAYANELAWRQDSRGLSPSDLTKEVLRLALAHPVSRRWKGYWQSGPAFAEMSGAPA